MCREARRRRRASRPSRLGRYAGDRAVGRELPTVGSQRRPQRGIDYCLELGGAGRMHHVAAQLGTEKALRWVADEGTGVREHLHHPSVLRQRAKAAQYAVNVHPPGVRDTDKPLVRARPTLSGALVIRGCELVENRDFREIGGVPATDVARRSTGNDESLAKESNKWDFVLRG